MFLVLLVRLSIFIWFPRFVCTLRLVFGSFLGSLLVVMFLVSLSWLGLAWAISSIGELVLGIRGIFFVVSFKFL
jgi:hypothetical protein